MSKNSKRVWGLYTVEELLCMVSYIPQEQAVSSIIINPLSTNPEESISRELSKVNKKLKFSGDDVAVSLPGNKAVIKKIDVDASTTDLDAMVKWQLDQQILGNVEEYNCGYQIIDQDEEQSRTRLLAAAYKRHPVDTLTQHLRKAKLHPVYFNIDVFSLVNAFEFNYSDRITTPQLLLYACSDSITFVITRNGDCIDYEIENIERAQDNVQQYTDALERGKAVMESTNGDIFSGDDFTCYYCGPLFSQIQHLHSHIDSMFGKTEAFDPFRNLSVYVQMDEKNKARYFPYLPIAVGAAVDAATE